MKIYFPVTDTSDALAIVSCDSIELQLESTWHRLEKIIQLCKDVVFAKVAANVVGCWLNLEMQIQGVRFTNNAAAVITPAMDPLSNGDKPAFKGLTDQTVNEFIPGTCYLIPYTAGAVTDMMPSSTLVGIENATDNVFVGSHYKYEASEKVQVRNGVGFTGCSYQVIATAAIENAVRVQNKEVARSVAFVSQLAIQSAR